jgi:hypothetical protein
MTDKPLLDEVPGTPGLFIGGYVTSSVPSTGPTPYLARERNVPLTDNHRMFSLRRKEAMSSITHVVTVLRMVPSDKGLFDRYKHLVIEVDDDDEENLLEHFITTNGKIQPLLEPEASPEHRVLI